MAADSRPDILTIVAQVVTADIDPALLQQDGDTVYEKKDKGIYSD